MNNRYYYTTENLGYENLGRKVITAKELYSTKNYNFTISDFLTFVGAFSKVVTSVSVILIPSHWAYQDWNNKFSLPHPGFIDFTKYVKVTYRVDRLTGKKHIDSSRLYIEADRYLYNGPGEDYFSIGKKTWSSRIK